MVHGESVLNYDTSVDDRLSMIEAELDEFDLTGGSPVSFRLDGHRDEWNRTGLTQEVYPRIPYPSGEEVNFRKNSVKSGGLLREAIESLHSVYSVPDVSPGLGILTGGSSNSSRLDRQILRRERDEERHRRISLQVEAEKYRRELARMEKDAIEELKLDQEEEETLERDMRRVKHVERGMPSTKPDYLPEEFYRAKEIVSNRDRDIDILTASLRDLEKQRSIAVSNSMRLMEENGRMAAELERLKEQHARDLIDPEGEDFSRNNRQVLQAKEAQGDRETVGTLADSIEWLSFPAVLPPRYNNPNSENMPGAIARRNPNSVGVPYATHSGVSTPGRDLPIQPNKKREHSMEQRRLPCIPKDQSLLLAPHTGARDIVSVVDPHRHRPPLKTVAPATKPPDAPSLIGTHEGLDIKGVLAVNDPQKSDPSPQLKGNSPTKGPSDHSSLIGNHIGIVPLGTIDVVDPQKTDHDNIPLVGGLAISHAIRQKLNSAAPPWGTHEGIFSISSIPRDPLEVPLTPEVERKRAPVSSGPSPPWALHTEATRGKSSENKKSGFRKASKLAVEQFAQFCSTTKELVEEQRTSGNIVFDVRKNENNLSEKNISGPYLDEKSSKLESSLLSLNLEREELEAWLGRIPAYSAGRTLAERKEKFLKEKRLSEVEKSVSDVRHQLKLLKHKRSNPMA